MSARGQDLLKAVYVNPQIRYVGIVIHLTSFKAKVRGFTIELKCRTKSTSCIVILFTTYGKIHEFVQNKRNHMMHLYSVVSVMESY